MLKKPDCSSFFRLSPVGTYSPGKESVVYEMSMQVFPTVPSPTTTHLIGRPEDMILFSPSPRRIYFDEIWWWWWCWRSTWGMPPTQESIEDQFGVWSKRKGWRFRKYWIRFPFFLFSSCWPTRGHMRGGLPRFPTQLQHFPQVDGAKGYLDHRFRAPPAYSRRELIKSSQL